MHSDSAWPPRPKGHCDDSSLSALCRPSAKKGAIVPISTRGHQRDFYEEASAQPAIQQLPQFPL